MNKFIEKSITLKAVAEVTDYLQSLYDMALEDSQSYIDKASNSDEYDKNYYLNESETCQIKAEAYAQITKLLDKLL